MPGKFKLRQITYKAYIWFSLRISNIRLLISNINIKSHFKPCKFNKSFCQSIQIFIVAGVQYNKSLLGYFLVIFVMKTEINFKVFSCKVVSCRTGYLFGTTVPCSNMASLPVIFLQKLTYNVANVVKIRNLEISNSFVRIQVINTGLYSLTLILYSSIMNWNIGLIAYILRTFQTKKPLIKNYKA